MGMWLGLWNVNASRTFLITGEYLLNVGVVEEECGSRGALHGGGITTQGDSFAELDAMVCDAIEDFSQTGRGPLQCDCTLSKNPCWPSHGTPEGCDGRAIRPRLA